MKYYELHEEFWKQLADKGHITWDRESKSDLMSRERNKELEEFLGSQTEGNALDLGSGSGSQSFYLTSLGFKCTAVDISKTAIDIGRKLSKELNYKIDFLCHDILTLDLNQEFDLVSDSCLLHCIVTESDRELFFNMAKNHMKDDARLFIYTMIREPGQKLYNDSEYLYLDDSGVLWSKGPDRFDVEWTQINGEKYFPHRRIYTKQEQRKEILSQGFEILEEKVVTQAEDECSTYVAWLKKEL